MSSVEGGSEGGDNVLAGRHIPWADNPVDVMESHKKVNESVTRTRFPPEPNGYLHIGHAKSMYMNFKLAFDKLGVKDEDRKTVFRMDDTNPSAENLEFVESLRRDLKWLGWKYEKMTSTSDYFNRLHDLAVELIKMGRAYVCFMDKQQVEAQRVICKKRAQQVSKGKTQEEIDAIVPSDKDIYPGKYRDAPIQDNLERFENMRKGKYPPGHCTLRMKMDLSSTNPNLHDSVAYRIIYKPHHNVPLEDSWCIYPSYDFSHCIIDSIEHIDYSICTLEFENRRESYYWLLMTLGLYRPKVYEMSRLNLSYTVLSKRKLKGLVEKGYVRGWDDPRMPTISGYRRRGYTKEVINGFCDDIGATRNDNCIDITRFEHKARMHLEVVCKRFMAVIDPVEVHIVDCVQQIECKVDDYPQHKGCDKKSDERDWSSSHNITFTPEKYYVDSRDVRLGEGGDKNFFGYAKGNVVGVKYTKGIVVKVLEIIEKDGRPEKIVAQIDDTGVKPKSYVSWVGSREPLKVEVREYGRLFQVEDVSDKWEDEVDPNGEVIWKDAIVDEACAKELNAFFEKLSKMPTDEENMDVIDMPRYQFERIGYYVIDKDTDFEHGKGVVFNSIVGLKEEKSKNTAGKDSADNEKKNSQRARQEMLKQRLSVHPSEYFTIVYPGKYKQIDKDGVPTHDGEGEEIAKSGRKKLIKELDKHKKAWEKNKKAQKN